MFSWETLETYSLIEVYKHMFKDVFESTQMEKSETGKTGVDFDLGYACHYQAHGACSTFHSLSTQPISGLLISIDVFTACR